MLYRPASTRHWGFSTTCGQNIGKLVAMLGITDLVEYGLFVSLPARLPFHFTLAHAAFPAGAYCFSIVFAMSVSSCALCWLTPAVLPRRCLCCFLDVHTRFIRIWFMTEFSRSFFKRFFVAVDVLAGLSLAAVIAFVTLPCVVFFV